MEPDFLTLEEVAAILRLPADVVEACIVRGDLRAARIGSLCRIARGDLDAFLAAVSEPPAPALPQAEVLGLLRACLPVTDDPEIESGLRAAGLRPYGIRVQDLARALTLNTPTPAWAICQAGGWAVQGHRLLIPLYDSAGDLRAVRACRIAAEGACAPAADPWVAGAPQRPQALVMAEMLALALLRHPSVPPGDHCYAAELVRRCGVWITGDELQFLSLATEWHADAERPAIFGVPVGAWSEGLALKIPDASSVTVIASLDSEGESYVRDIMASFGSRVGAGGIVIRRRAPRTVSRG